MKLNSILFPTDFSASCDAALDYASSLAAETGAILHIVHVADDSPAYLAGYGGFAYVPDLPTALEKEMRGRLNEVKPSKPGVRVMRHYLTGPAAKGIVEFSDQEHVDLIVMGSHGRSGLSRVLMGSIAEGVLRGANCPVLTVKFPHDAKSKATESSADSESETQTPVRSRFSLH